MRLFSHKRRPVHLGPHCAERLPRLSPDATPNGWTGTTPSPPTEKAIPGPQAAVNAFARYQELFELVHDEIRASGLEEQIAAGLVLTGGTAKMEGAVEFAEELFQMPVRVGKPINVKGLSEYVDDAGFATVVGLLQYGKVQSDNKKSSTQKTGESLFHRVQSWFKGEF